MPLNYPKLRLPDAPETVALRAVETILATDPTLSRVVQCCVAWRGETFDLAEPTWATCPHLTLSPAPAASDWETEGQHSSPLVIQIRCVVAGTDADQLLNFWGAVRSALFPADPDRRAVVEQIARDARIVKPILRRPAYGVKSAEKGEATMAALGSLELKLHVNT